MLFRETPIHGAFLVQFEPLRDDRGYFARTFSRDEFKIQGLCEDYPQCNSSFNETKGTLRGMHYQIAPFEEPKLIRCTRGKIFDVIVDLRPGSASHLAWHGIVLDQEEPNSLYVPAGVAHGFLTLEDRSEVFYQMGQVFSAPHANGVRWDDPAFGIKWPFAPTVISAKDRSYQDCQP